MLDSRDRQLIHELKSVCADGYSFYEMTARKASSSDVRMLFRELALVREEVVNDINKRFSGMKNVQTCNTELARTVRAIYSSIAGKCRKNVDKECLGDLELMENRALEIFKINVRRIRDRRISSFLAGHLASIQLSQDRLHRLKNDRQGQSRQARSS